MMKSPMGWLTWIILLILLGSMAMQLVSGVFGFKDVPMNEIVATLNGDTELKEVVLVEKGTARYRCMDRR